MGVKVHSHWRHLAAQIAIVGLIVRVFMAAVMLPMPLLMSTGALASPLDNGPIVVCTGTGFVLVSVDENGNLTEKPLPGHSCPVCDALAIATFAVEAAQAELAVTLSSADTVLPVDARIPAKAACLAHNNRGPPQLV